MFTIIVLGIVLFQLLFNIITGGGSQMEDMSNVNAMGYSATTLDNLVTGLLVLLVKLLLISLIISLFIGVILWIKKNFLKNINLKQYVNQNPIMKSILMISVVMVGLILLIYIYQYLISAPALYQGNMGNSAVSYNTNGFSGVLGITGVITFLIKVLTYVFVITLIIGLVAYLKKQIESGEFHLFNTGNPMDKSVPNQTNATSDLNQKTQEQNKNNTE